MASRKEQKEQLRAERVAREAVDHATERRRRLIQYGSGAAFLAVCAIVALIVVSQSGGGDSAGSRTEDATAVQKQLKGIPQDGTVLGDPKAKVTVVEYGDLQCPVCKAFSEETAPALISDVVRKDTANYDLRQYTIIGPESADAARAALAAGEQGRYWNFIQLFYRNQGTENSGYVTDSFLESIAKGAGVPDLAKWNEERNSPKWDATLSKVQGETQALGISSTPTIVVEGPGGKQVVGSGVLPASQIEDAIKSVD